LQRPQYFVISSSTMNENIRLLFQGARCLGVDLDHRQLTLFDLYQKELLHWNTKFNLISEKTTGEIISRHFLDSLTASNYLTSRTASIVCGHSEPIFPARNDSFENRLSDSDFFGLKVLDIGSGAGFPGIPLKIAFPSIQLYLLESNRKKNSFLKNIIRLLCLQDVFTFHDRAENIVRTHVWHEKFDIMVSRASLKLHDLLPLGIHFLSPGGRLVTLKGPSVSAEISLSFPQNDHLKFFNIFQYDIKLPISGPPRKILVACKVK
jgi:16S rRNA (guanine527-N7)-methyltransferase